MSENQDGKVRMWRPGDAPEPVKRRPWVPPPDHVVSWVCVPRPVSVVVHWTGERHQPCLMHGPAARCPHCVANVPTQVQHWLQVVSEPHGSAVPELVCLSVHAYESHWRLCDDFEDLTALSLETWRQPAHSRGALFCAVGTHEPAVSVPRVQDTLALLHILWRARLRSGKSGPLPPRRPPGDGPPAPPL